MVSRGELNVETSVCQLITSEQAWHYQIIPKDSTDQQFSFYISNQNNYNDLREELYL
jgi:hypothetical protein